MDEQQGENAFNLHQRIAANELLRRRLMGQNIGLLKQIKSQGLYKVVLGDEKADWTAYLGQIETFYTRNDVYNLFRIYDKFVIDLGFEYETISDIPKSRLIDLLPVVNENNVEELLSQARTLTSRDFTDNIREMKGLKTTDQCEHNYKKMEICSHCGEKHQLNESEKSISE